METPVKKLLMGFPAERAANRDAMSNPGSLDYFAAFATRLRDRFQLPSLR
jgi:acetoacetyl-CoA synthetase